MLVNLLEMNPGEVDMSNKDSIFEEAAKVVVANSVGFHIVNSEKNFQLGTTEPVEL